VGQGERDLAADTACAASHKRAFSSKRQIDAVAQRFSF
jgi:hypothetical protein